MTWAGLLHGYSFRLRTILTIDNRVSRPLVFIRRMGNGGPLSACRYSCPLLSGRQQPAQYALIGTVMSGMLVTAFLPVYMGVRGGGVAGLEREYVGNLLGILLLCWVAISLLLGTVFAPGSLYLDAIVPFGDYGSSMDTAAFMFRFFAIQILFYGLGSVFSGVLNAPRLLLVDVCPGPQQCDASLRVFMGFAPVSALKFSERAGIILIAAGTTFRCLCSDGSQIPALGKHGVHPHIHIDLRTPRFARRLSARYPDAACHGGACFVSTSITNAAALVVQPETGPSVIAYARLWYHAALRADCRLAFDGALYRALTTHCRRRITTAFAQAFRVASPRCCSS